MANGHACAHDSGTPAFDSAAGNRNAARRVRASCGYVTMGCGRVRFFVARASLQSVCARKRRSAQSSEKKSDKNSAIHEERAEIREQI